MAPQAPNVRSIYVLAAQIANRPCHAFTRLFRSPVTEVARELIGVALIVDGVGGPIVETEAYDHEDPASNVSRADPRNAAMFGPPATPMLRSYGIHWCLNLVCRPGSAVLIRRWSRARPR